MSRKAGLFALTLALAAGGAQAQTTAPAPAPAPQGAPGAAAPPATPTRILFMRASPNLRSKLELLKISYGAARERLKTMEVRFEAGLSTSSELTNARTEAALLEAQIRSTEQALQTQVRLASLEQPVEVRFADASMKQVALALSAAGGMPVNVDPSVPLEKRLTIDARGVTLGLLLETVAQKADLMIAPDAQGLVIRPWPTLEVQGERTIRRGPYAPWSDEWKDVLFFGGLGGGGTPFASGGGVISAGETPPSIAENPSGLPLTPAPPYVALPVPGLGAPLNVLPAPDAAPFSRGALGVPLSYQFSSPVNLAPLGEKAVVLAEPGVGPNGEAGQWLSVYRLEGDKLRKVSSVFHQSVNGAPATSLNRRSIPFGMGAPAMAPRAVPAPPKSVAPRQTPGRPGLFRGKTVAPPAPAAPPTPTAPSADPLPGAAPAPEPAR